MADGRRAMDRGDFEGAARRFREVAEAHPDEPAPWQALGEAEMEAQRYPRAREAFEHLATLRPASATPHVLVGETYELERRYDEALVAYHAACEAAPESPQAFRVIGTRLLRWGHAEEAIPFLERAHAIDPSHRETRNALAMARVHTGDLAGAERDFRAIIDSDADFLGARVGLAALLVNAHRFDEALAAYDAIVARWPRFAAAHVGRGLLLHELGRRDEALAAFRQAVAVADDRPRYEARLREYEALIAEQ
jgi:tetratricopeptide (TPR) repeat protein